MAILQSLMTDTAVAQTVCLPLPRVLTTMPMGGKVGTEFEITVTGENIDDGGDLIFSHPGLTATPQKSADGKTIVGKYLVRTAADCPSGLYETRMMTRLGISSARVFSVGTLDEVRQTPGNTSLAKAMPLPMNSVCNSVMSSRSVDHYSFEAKAGQRCLVHCAARGIDSKLDAVLVVGNAMGQDLLVERRGGVLDFKAPADGTYIIKVHELTYKGGDGYFYRLTLQELGSDATVPEFASTRPVNTFSWPPQGLPVQAALQETEPNNSATQIQKISLPCDLAGSFATAADVDIFEFDAKKGEVWWVEVASERLGRPTDPSIVVQRVTGDPGAESLTDVAELTDIPSPMKPSSNGYAYDGPPYDGGSSDINGKIEIPEDGRYRLQITDLFGGTRTDPRNVYRLVIRQAAPDFALVAWGLHMELRNGDRNALSKPVALRGGVTVALEVVAIRRDGFAGDIELSLENLPEGVKATGLKIPAGSNRGIVLITADQNAPRALSWAKFTGKARINDAEVVRPCQIAAMAWPIVDAWGEIPSPRLVADFPISVSGSEYAPISIAARESKIWEVVAGQKLTVPMIHTRRTDFSGTILQLRTFGAGFEGNPQFDVSLTAETSDISLDTAALKTPPGDYLVAFYGSAVAKYRYNPDGVSLAEQDLKNAEAEAASAVADVQKRTEELAAATEEQKAERTQLLDAAKLRQTATEAVKAAATAALKAANDKATPRDTVDIVITEPIAIRVLPAEAK
ncbi:MAG: serine protease [Planctomycetaceae bacterium]|nr:serine protease [Planctomycetaceae bacterium]